MEMENNNTLINIPEFTAEQYYSTSEPYEYLYQFRDDKFALRQMCERMKQQAGALGVKSFMALWNAYQESRARKNGLTLANATDFYGQPIELYSGDYICNESGVSIMDKYGYEEIVCAHPILPVRRLINADTGEERLQLCFKKGKIWRSIIVEKAVIASSSSILQLAANGVLVTSENAKALSTYLLTIENLNYDDIPEQMSIGRLGWIMNDNFSPYVDDLIFDGESNFKTIFASVKAEGDREKWIEIMQKMRAEHSMGRVFLAASFASVLIKPCGLLPFFVHAWGGTECGKTVGLQIAASVWACPKMGEYITTFNATSVGQEMLAAFLNSLPMCIDELQIQSSAGIKDFDKIIYQLAEGVGRTRGAKTGGLQRVNTWKNCIITNGEHPISNTNSGGGAINRLIEFECDKKIYSDLPYISSVIQANYGFAGKEFVEYLRSDGAIDRVIAMQKDYYRQLLQTNSTEKQAASVAALLTADYIATELFFNDNNNLTVADVAQIMAKKDDIDINLRAYDYIVGLVACNPNRFKPNGFGEYAGEVWGKVDSEYIYIVKTVFDREMAEAGYNSTAFLSWAKRNGYIICDNGKRTKKARICDRALNCICLFKDTNQIYQQTPDDNDCPF